MNYDIMLQEKWSDKNVTINESNFRDNDRFLNIGYLGINHYSLFKKTACWPKN